MSGEGPTATGPATGRATAGRLAWLRDPALLRLCLGSLVVVAVGALAQVTFGPYPLSVPGAWGAVVDPGVLLDARWTLTFLLGEGPMRAVTGYAAADMPALPTDTIVVWTIRLPRVVVAVLVGMNLAVSGAIFQAVTRNELASPFILGVSSGAGLTILLALVVFDGLVTVLPLVAALGGAVAFLLVYAIAWQHGTSPVRLVLAGVVVSTVAQSLQTGLFFFADDIGVVQTALAWTTGSLTGVGWGHVRMVLPWTVLTMSLAVLGARQLNVLLLGGETARSLGVSVERVRFGLSGVAVVAAAASIAVAGIVSFVGLIVPHVVRNVVGSDYKKLVVGCLFAGPALLVAADLGARLGLLLLTGSNSGQMPVGIVTGLIGGPYFLYLMRRRQTLGEL